MNIKKVISFFVIVVGIAMLGGAYYIKGQVNQGKIRIAAGEQRLNQADAIFSLPGASVLGDHIKEGGKRKITAGNRDIAYYTKMANYLQIGGIVFISLGLVFFAISFRRKA